MDYTTYVRGYQGKGVYEIKRFNGILFLLSMDGVLVVHVCSWAGLGTR